MRSVLAFAAVLSTLIVGSAYAGDGSVAPSTRKVLGLSSMQRMTDGQGAQVRGRSANAVAMGTSLISGLLIDPATKSFLFGASADAAMSSAENGGSQVFTQATSSNASSLNLNLTVTTGTSTYTGVLIGGAGGAAAAAAQ